MAQRTTTLIELVDDLDGGKAVETVSFAIDGAAYEIDLSARNARAMRKAIGVYVAAARPAGTVMQAGEAPAATNGAAPARKARTNTRRAPAARSGTRTTRTRKTADKPAAAKSSAEGPTQSEIRGWAAGAGVEVPSRGRISNAVRDQYLAAQVG